MKLVDHVRWHVCEGHERLFRRLPPFSLSLCRVPVFFPRQETENARPPRARGACVLADKRETLELYISILGLDKRDRRESLQPWTLGASRGIGAHGNSWEEDRGRNWMEREREGRRGDGFVVFLLFYRSFWAPLPEKGAKDLDNEERSFWWFRFRKFRRSISQSHAVENVCMGIYSFWQHDDRESFLSVEKLFLKMNFTNPAIILRTCLVELIF